jgi:hypothetical protein
VAFPSGASPADGGVVSGTFRLNLAPTTGSVTDYLRALQTSVNTGIVALSRLEQVTIALNDRGKATFSISGGGTVTWTLSSSLAALLGFTATTYSAVASITATHLPRHLYTFLGGDSEGWQEATEIAARPTTAGAVVGVYSGIKRWTDTLRLEFIPKNPTLAAAADQVADWSPWEPDPGGGTTFPWTLAELRRTALTQTLALTRDWNTVRTSTSAPYELVTLDPDTLATPKARQQFASYTPWWVWEARLLAGCDATNTWLRQYGTRA